MSVYDPGDQAHRRQVMKDEALAKLHPSQRPPEPTTLFAMQSNSAKPHEPVPTLQVPRLPPGSPWAGDPVGPEPLIDGSGEGNALGYPIDRVLP
jgi:hypothetical protein